MRAKRGQTVSVWLLSEMNVTLSEDSNHEDLIDDALDCTSAHRTLQSAKAYALLTIKEALEEYHENVTGQPDPLLRQPSLSWATTSSLGIWDAEWKGESETDDWKFRIREVLILDF